MTSLMKFRANEFWSDIEALFFRVAFGGMMLLGHGWTKLANFQESATIFPSAFGLGSSACLFLAVFAEFFCSLALIMGLVTRLVLVPLVLTMATAAFVIHSSNPFEKKELALVYLFAYVHLFFTGPGRYSLDRIITNTWRS